MGYTDLLNEPNVYISYNGNDNPVINNTDGGSLQLTRTPTGSTATFANDNPNSEFGSCLVTQVPNMQSWTGSGTPADLYSNTNKRWKQEQETTATGWEFWIKIDSSVNIANDLMLLEWVDGSEITRVNLTTDRKIMLTGSLLYAAYSGIGVNATVYSDPLSLDEWHLISVTGKTLYMPPGTYSHSFEFKGTSHMFVDGKIIKHVSLTNDYIAKSLRMPTKLFSEISIPGIKLAHFAYWNNGITHKQHTRRYMYGKAKNAQRYLVLQSDPYIYSYMDYSQDNNNYVLTGTYRTDPETYSAINPSAESVSTGALDFNYHGGVEGTTCIRFTKAQGDPTIINGAGNMYVGTSTDSSNILKKWQDNALNTGNYSLEFWYRNGMSIREYDDTASGLSPIMLIIVNGSVVQNIRLTNQGEMEYVVKLNNSASSTSVGWGSQWTMRETGKRVDNEWHHVAVVSTYNNPVLNVKVYVDGTLYQNYQNNNVQVLNSSYQVNPADSAAWLWAFMYGAANQQASYAQLDNLALYTRQLTEGEISSRYLQYNIVERPHFIGVKQRKNYAHGGTSGAGYIESTKNILQPADNVLYHNGSTFVRNTNQIKFYNGTDWQNN